MRTNLFKSLNLIRCVSGASLTLFRYTAKSCDSQGVVTATSYGASDEHPISIRSASDGTSWKAGIWKYAAMLLCLLTIGIGNAWAHSTHNGKVTFYNATGNGTVYLSTASGSNSGETAKSSPESKNGYSQITWSCGGSSDKDTKTLYPRGTVAAGYYYLGWSTSSSATSGYSTGSLSANASSDTDKKIYGYFETIKVTAAPADVNINPTDPYATYPDAAGVVVGFTTSSSNANSDFTTGGSGDSRWTISAWPTHASATSTTFNYKFVGNGSYGTNNRTLTKTVTLKGLNDATVKTCTLTAKYPNPRVVACDAEATDLTIYPTFKAADATQEAVEKTAVFDVVYADNANNFTAAFSSTTGSGAWDVTGISVDQANQKATVTYTFNGNKIATTHTAVLTLTANNCQGWDDTSADGGASATITLTAENTQEATDDVLVTNANEETVYQGDFATALASYQGTGYTFKLLRNVDLGTITATKTINKAMTIDLNGKELRAAVNKSEVPMLTFSASVTVKDSKTGGKIINEHALNGQLRTITVSGGTFTLESGTIAVHNTGQYAGAANSTLGVAKYASCTCRVLHQNAGTTVNINGGKLDAVGTRSVYGIVQGSTAATNKAGTTVLNVTGGEIAAEAPYNAFGIYAYGKVNMSAGVINTHINTDMVDAQYAADNANNTYNGYAYGIYLYPSASATATSCYAGILNMTGGTINVTNDRTVNANLPSYGVLFGASAANVSSATAVAADGKSHGQIASATGSIDGGEINVNSGTQNSYGVYVTGGYNSYDNSYHTVQIKNCKITSKAYVSAYGVYAHAAINSTNGACYAGDVELTNCDVYAESLNTTSAMAVWAYATSTTIFKDGTTANAATWGGEFAVAGKAVINNGKYEAKSKTSSAYAAGTSSRAKSTWDAETTVPENRKRGGKAEAYPTLIIHGGTFKATSITSTARGVSNGGYCTIDGGEFDAFATTTTAHGLYCLTGKITASGVKVSASATGTAYGAFADVSIPSYSSYQTGFAMAGELELNNCDITATTRTSTEARGVYVAATNKLHNWAQFHTDSTSGKWAAATTAWNHRSVFPCYVEGRDSIGIAIAGKAVINGGTINATAETTTAYGIYALGSQDLMLDSIAIPELTVRNTKITVATNGTTSAWGIYTQGKTLVDGCDITVTPKSSTGYGIQALAANDTKVTVRNTKITVNAATTAYGLHGNVDINTKNGQDRHGNFVLEDGNIVTANATSGNTSYALYLSGTKRNIAAPATTPTDISAYRLGDYANAATAVINGGSYKATATGTTAYGVGMVAQQVQGSTIAQPECTINGGKFWGKATGGTDGAVNGSGVQDYFVLKGGVYNVNTNLAKYIPEGLEEVPLASDRTEYGEGYRYEIAEAGMHGIDVCQIGSTKYKSLEEALQVVTSGQVIYMIANYTMATPGDYVLPANTTLLIPYKTGSGKGATTAIGNAAETTTSGTTPTLFRKLTLGAGVNLTCFGIIETSAQQKANGQYGANVGMPSGAYGQIHMEEGSHISLEANSRLNCWGYITGKGTINVKKNAAILEGFQMGDWCGGTNYGTLGDNSQKVFPVTHYFYQSIECPVTYRPGSRAYGSSHINVSYVGVVGQDNIALVGTSGSMFIMDDNDVSAETWVMKDYDEATDQCIWTINSGASLGNLTIEIYSYRMRSANYDLPITTNMSVILNYGEMALGQNTVFLPGSKLIVNKQGTAVLNGVTVTAYDAADWTGTTRYFATYSPTWGTTNPRKNIAVADAEIFLHGKLDIRSSGGLYTTPGGANIHSTNADAGEVIYTTAAQGNKTNYYLQQGTTTRTAVTTNPARLKNGDGSYAASAGTTAGKTWTYKNDVWDAWSKDGCFFVNAQDEPHAKPAALVQLTSKTPDSNHLHHDAATGTRNFVWDENCYWWEVSTTPTAEGYYLSLNADNNGDYNYYYYDNAAACWKIKKITITWNINGTTTNYSVGYGTKPEWLGATPTKTSSSSDYVWRWDGWTQGSSTEVIDNKELPIVTENTTFTAHFYEKYYEYNVTFKNSDGTILDSRNWRAGTTPSYEGTPTKNATVDYTYEFNGTWNPDIKAVDGSATYVAQYDASPRAYTITFLNYDMSVLGTAEVVYNGTPSNATYLAAVAPLTDDPYKPDNSAFSFEFAGWRLQGASSNGFAQVKGDQTYIAQYDQTTKKYKVSFVDDDGETVLHYLQLEYGQTPSYTWADPANKQDVEWNYTFSGWDPATFSEVQGPQTYVANYSKTKREYTITWKDGDGNTLKTDQVAYGSTPSYSGATPTKTSTNTHNYTFNNTWSPAIVDVEGEATYTAQFNETERKYRVTWDAATNGGTCTTEYNDFSYNAAIGTLPDASKTGHEFNGWFTSATGGTQITTATKVTADVTYHAHFMASNYAVTLHTNSGTINAGNVTSYTYGVGATLPTNVSRTGYDFVGWFENSGFTGAAVTNISTTAIDAKEYWAKWTPISYTITFDSNGGTPVSSITQGYETSITAPANPTRTGYTFAGWDPEVPSTMPLNGTTCVAQWTPNTNTAYTVKHYKQNLDGTYPSTPTETDNLTGTTGEEVTPDRKSYEGFDAPAGETVTILADGSRVVTYNYTRKSYDLSWVTDGYALTGDYTHGSVKFGASITAPNTPTKTGYTFNGWSPAKAATMPAADAEYTATWTANTNTAYTVEHYWQNINDGNYTMHETVGMTGTTDAVTAAVAKNYTGFEAALPFEQGTVAPNGSTVVKIYYNRKTYLIKWDVKLNGEQEAYKEETLRYGAMPSYGADPTKEQSVSQVYSFSGWSPTPYAVDKDQTYNGSFKVAARPYTITFVNDNGVELWHSDFGYGSTPSYGGSDPVSSHTGDGYTYTHAGWKPALAQVNDTATYTAKYDRSAEAITVSTPETVTDNTIASTTTVENGGALTIEEAELQSTTIIVESGGQLNVEESGSIEADVFIIQATTEEQGEPEALEEVQVSGELSETGSQNLQAVYYDLTRKHGNENFLARVWYAVAVPWAVEVPTYSNGGVFIKRGENYIPQRLGATFDLLSYDGDCRAQNGASADCWVYLEDEIDGGADPVMVPGKLYMIYLTEETSTIRFKKKVGEAIHTNTLTVSAHETENGNDANWNGIANPATYRAYMNVNVGDGGLVQKFVPGTQPRDGGRYLPLDLDDRQAVGQPFFVQVDPEAGTSVVVTRTNPSAAPRRAKAEQDQEARYAIGLAANGKLADRLYIQTAEEKEDRYVIGKDMSKMGVSSYVAQMWVERYNSKLCLNTMTLTRDIANYPLGISAPQAGEYKIFAPADITTGDNIYLTFNGRVIWNLTMAPYYASLEKGTTTSYGLRIVHFNTPAVTTGTENIQSDDVQCTKVIMDDHVYILRGEEIYTITGQKAK